MTSFLLFLLFAAGSHASEPLRERVGSPADLPHTLPRATLQSARSINHVEMASYALERQPAGEFEFALAKRGVEGLLDENPATLQRLDGRGDRALDIVFLGASEWVNQVELQLRGDAAFHIDFLQPDGLWLESGIRIESVDKLSLTRELFEVPVGRYQGMRVRLAGETSGYLELAEAGAYWFEPEALKDAYETADEWAEDYPGTSNDLSSPNLTCQRFSDYLRDRGWTWLFDWGDNDCWEEDYKLVSLGGNNNSWVDATDAFIHCSHGSNDELNLARDDRDDPDVTWGDINGAWGDGDVEWVFVHCCLNMKNLYWHNSLNGVHTVSGWRNVISSSSNWGKTIAQKLWDSGAFDSSWTIWQSWWHSNDTNQPSGNKGTLVAEDYGHFNEYIWGQGPVLSDSPDSQHWYTDHTVSKTSKMGDVYYGTGPTRSSEPILWEPRPGLGKAGEPAMKLYVHPEVLDEAIPKGGTPVGIYNVLPPDVDVGGVEITLGRICALLGEACPTLAGGVEDQDAVAAGAGNLVLSASVHSGSLLFTDVDKFMVPGSDPGALPDPAAAASIAESFLGSLQLLNPEQQVISVQTMVATQFQELVPGQIEILQQFPFMHEVVFGKSIGPAGTPALPVLGPGGRAHVSVGPSGEILAMNLVDRKVQLREVLPAIHPQEVLDLIAAFGYPAVESAPEFPASSIVVRDMNLGYFERTGNDAQPVLGPIYYLDVDLVSAAGKGGVITEPGRLFLTADVKSLVAEIQTPSDGASFPLDSEVQFAGIGMNGTPPYSYEWSSSVQGVLSTASSFSTKTLFPSVKQGGASPFTIEFVVTDVNGYSASAQISMSITGVTENEDLPSRFVLEQNAPNPFNPRTTIAFRLPEAADVTLAVYDLRGRRIRTILDRAPMQAGLQSRIWEGTDASGRPVAAGVYIYRLTARSGGELLFEQERKMTLIK